jgi:6-phosphogluconolactonase
MIPSSPSSFVAYVSCSAGREIHSFRIDAASGTMSLVEVVGVPGDGDDSRGNMPLAIARDGRRLYAHLRGAPYPLASFEIESESGRLRLLETVDLPAPMTYVATTRNGRFLLGASYDDACLAVNAIAADGRVDGASLQLVHTPPKAHCIRQWPRGDLVFATSVSGNVVLSFRLDEASGRLEPLKSHALTSWPHAGPRHLVFHPTLDILYAINEHAGSVIALAIDPATGALDELQCKSIMPAGFSGNARAGDIHLTPDGRLLYASVRDTDAIWAFKVSPATGTLERAGRFAVETAPRGFAIEPGGRFLLCAGQTSDTVGVYAIDAATGGLSLHARYPVGKRPSWIEVLDLEAGRHAA